MIFSWLFFVFALLWTVGSSAITYLEHSSVTSNLDSGNYSVIEGTVTDFVPMPYAGHFDESFTVKGQRFSYSDYVSTSGFNNTTSHGGPIHEGLHVRIAYFGGLILRLEVAEQ